MSEILTTPPQDLEAEMALLGSILIHAPVLADVLAIIPREEAADCFMSPKHATAYQVVVDMDDRRQPIDLVTVRDELRKRGRLATTKDAASDCVAVEDLVRFTESVGSYLIAKHYAEIVRDKAILRRLLLAAERVRSMVLDPTADAKEVTDKAEQIMTGITERRVERHADSVMAEMDSVFQTIDGGRGTSVQGTPTGYEEMDHMLCGLQRDELILVAGRPSMGKTAWVMNVVEFAAIQSRIPVVVFSAEMSRMTLVQRMLCSFSRVNSQHLRRGCLSAEEIALLKQSEPHFRDAPLYIDDTPAPSVMDIRCKARHAKQKYGVELVVIDYLQLLKIFGRFDSRAIEVGEIGARLKSLAAELHLPVMVAAQLNRKSEERKENRPRMSDLRESGALEQHADTVILLHREDYYHKGEEGYQPTGIAEVIIDKQRNGPTGTVKMRWQPECTRFDALSTHEQADREVVEYLAGKRQQEEARLPYNDTAPVDGANDESPF